MMDYKAMEQEIRQHAKEWLEAGEVKYVLGYEKGPNGLIARPIFIRDAAEADRLYWGPDCINNLTRFLVEDIKKKPKRGEEPDTRSIGIVVKPCDSKTIVELMKENMLPRERVKIIGVATESTIDPDKLKAVVDNGVPLEKRGGIRITDGGNDYVLKYDGGELKVPKDELDAEKCKVCVTRKPVIADVTVGKSDEPFKEDDFSDIKELEDMSEEERWKYWEQQLSKCVRCYACRDACPLCYCEECVFDREKPYRWNEKTVELSENLFYHMVRAMHLAGRCIDCGECQRVCPMGIPIRQLNRFLIKQAKERFDLRAGINVEDKPMFGTYDTDDPGEEIW